MTTWSTATWIFFIMILVGFVLGLAGGIWAAVVANQKDATTGKNKAVPWGAWVMLGIGIALFLLGLILFFLY